MLERALEVAGNDLDTAIKNLNNLRLESAEAVVNFADNNKPNAGIEANIWQSSEGMNYTYTLEII